VSPPVDRASEKHQRHAADDARHVGKAIELERSKASLTQSDLAQLSGVSQAHISNIEKGRWSPKLNTVMLIAEALGVDVNTLLPAHHRDQTHRSLLRAWDGTKTRL
jgi:transcriptional regulator with XRE-family HTH domain